MDASEHPERENSAVKGHGVGANPESTTVWDVA
jgi:hypothetical protein